MTDATNALVYQAFDGAHVALLFLAVLHYVSRLTTTSNRTPALGLLLGIHLGLGENNSTVI